MSIQSTYGLNPIDIDLPYAFPSVVVAKSPLRRICIQAVIFWPNIWIQTQISFSDSLSGTVIGILNIPASPPQVGDGSNGIFVNFIPTGTILSPGANLNMSVSPLGVSGRLHLETYQKGSVFALAPYVAPSASQLAVSVPIPSFGN